MLTDVPPQVARTSKVSGLGFIRPLRPTLVYAPPVGDGWIHEIKHDGHRTMLVLENGAVRAFTRNGHDWTDRYTRVVSCAADLTCRSAIIDGEIIVRDQHGVSDFPALRRAMKREPHRLVFFAFDLLHLDSEDLRPRPLRERKQRLAELLGPADPLCPIQLSNHYDGSGCLLLKAAEKLGLEGIISKKLDSRYVSGASKAWLKTKCWASGEFIVIGTEPGNEGPPLALLARQADNGLVYAGSAFVTLGQERDLFWSRVTELARDKPALEHLRNRKASWCRPEMRVNVRHLRGGGMLRHAIVAGLCASGPSD